MKQYNLIKTYKYMVFDLITTYKSTVKQLHSLQIAASVLFVYFFIKAYVVDNYLNCTIK